MLILSKVASVSPSDVRNSELFNLVKMVFLEWIDP